MALYSVHDVTTRAELDAVIDVAWRAWWDPYITVQRIMYPVIGDTTEDLEKNIAMSKQRIWLEHEKSLPSGKKKWICAKHVNGEIAGGLLMDFVSESPFPNGCPKPNFYWWPESSEIREFCEEMLRQALTPRSVWMQRPHGGMSNLVVDPKHRGKGVGTLLLSRNSEELDQRGIEGFVESSEMGRSTYEKAGFQVVIKMHSFIPTGKSILWKKWHQEMALQPMFAMWRPKFGTVSPGNRTKPWQMGPSIPVE